ncbi:MAG: A/G-specific adenine glycosylase [Oscillospiraceae bacterium]|nr:A/G-specific adenine glycosylase [Oscillospiraceae bacterium]
MTDAAFSAHDETAVGAQYEKLPGALLPWYGANARALPWRENTEPYRVWLSEIMLQQTRVEAATAYYLRFLAALPTIRALAQAPEQQLLKLWEGLGYYTRARNLQKAARIITEQYGGDFPIGFEDIRALPGVGEYTAGAVASICFEQPTPAVDGNVLRILARITEDTTPVDGDAVKRRAAARLKAVYPERGRRGAFTQALMELGATVCTPQSPRCAVCPAADFCFAAKSGTQTLLPVRPKKKPRRAEDRTVLLLRCGDCLALTRRPDSGLLRGLWQLPDAVGVLDADAALQAAAAWGVRPLSIAALPPRRHLFTHVEWDMRGYLVSCGARDDRFVWETPADIRARYALPTAYRVFLSDCL